MTKTKLWNFNIDESNLEQLKRRLTSQDDNATAIQRVGAWLWSHANGSEETRDIMLATLGLKRKLMPTGESIIY